MQCGYNMRCVVRNRVANRLIANYCHFAVNEYSTFFETLFFFRLESHHVEINTQCPCNQRISKQRNLSFPLSHNLLDFKIGPTDFVPYLN